MDINKKLEFYKQNTAQKPEKVIQKYPSALKALSEHFGGDILYPYAPVLKISRKYEIRDTFLDSNQNNSQELSLFFLNKNTGPKSINLQNCLFFDLETTGLMGGAGTFPFLLGFGRFNGSTFTVEQYFLPEFGREYYLYKDLQDELNQTQTLISFNGKSYDLPLLKSRFIMNHLMPEFDKKHHIDLLHISRRIWKNALSSCDLVSIESNILDRTRTDDIPGWLIPQAYFDFLNYNRLHDIIRIIEHNYLDIISLAELILLLSRINSAPERLNEPKSLLRMAALAYELGDNVKFEKIYSALLQRDTAEIYEPKVWKSLLHKRNSEWEKAINLWDELIQTNQYSFFALEELAKYFEHQKKAPQKALDFSERALKKISVARELEQIGEDLVEIEERFKYRRTRLILKLS